MSPTSAGWAGPVSPYTQSIALDKCPDDSTGPAPAFAAANGTAQTNKPVSYALNENMGNQALAQLAAPASSVMLCEVQNALAVISERPQCLLPGGGDI